MKDSRILRAFTFLAVLSISESKCSYERDFNRHFYMDGQELPLNIEVSNRIAHQLVSNVLQILLTEAMGYSDVKLVHQDERYANGNTALMTLQKMTNCSDPKDCREDSFIPGVMINLEMWVTPGFNMEPWVNTGKVDDCGSFGPIGRSSWFIPLYAVRYHWLSNGTIVDHWRAFQNPDVTIMFDLTLDGYLDRVTTKEARLKLCTDKTECGTDGVYRPVQCRTDKDVRCATILADFPESSDEALKKKIDSQKLLVNVVWLGSNLNKVVEQLVVIRKQFIIVNKMPSYLSTVGEFNPVAFPACKDPWDDTCEDGVNTLKKVAWSKIRTHAPHAYHVIRGMSLSQVAYLGLLSSYKHEFGRGRSVYDVACTWVKNNEFEWLGWMPDDYSNKTPLYIGGIFPIKGTYWKQSGVTVAAEMAVNAINKNEKILGKYHLEVLEQDGRCTADQVMKCFINYVTNVTYPSMIGILGPACSDTVEPVAGVAKHFNTIIMSYSAEGALFSNREKYPYFFRTIPENNLFRFVYLKMFKKLGWKRVAALTEDGQKYPEYLSHLQDLMQANGLTFIVNRKFPRERTSLDMMPYLKELKEKGARIIIGDFYDNSARAIMCDAYKLQMTASHGYQWFLPLWFTADWFNTDAQRSDTNTTLPKVSCTTEQMVEAINGHMSLAYKYYADKNSIMQENITVEKWYEMYTQTVIKQKKEPSQYAGYTYDAVWVYATAMDALLKENDSHVSTLHTKKTSRRLVELLNETNMEGVTGLLSFMGSSRISDVNIWQWVRNSTKMVGMYQAITQTEGNLILNEKHIVWLTRNGQRPGDGGTDSHECALEGLKSLLGSSCNTAIVVVNVIGFMIFAILVMVAVAGFKLRYDRRIRLTEERMKELGLATGSGPFALDEWEMAREHIVVNRKLGEGAFGTVFGGEAMVSGGAWIAVAVKTLKAGAKSEEKLDFLSEAEVMKQFDHRNIVKLIGVCTTGEPVYTIMEFMLYGDLKTYLLSRRHLVSDKDRQNSPEVSDRKLTSMSLDIARGLSYLADLKFVHRDLACRNCLVNSARCVKIADFGMCRAMYDSDYYRYNKKGMLPVRWMAPESLIDGLFTPMSDVWSYGVILFEIVTFASFPYQGLSNAQVLERIKNFDTLHVPHGCGPELTDLFLKCWRRNQHTRPPAAEIVEILANQPELISPSLDTPTASVEPDSDSLDISIHDHTRHHSFSYIWQSRRKAASMDQTEPRLVDSPKAEKYHKKMVSKHIAMATFPNRKLSFPYETMLSQTPRDSFCEKIVVEDIPEVTYL